MRSIRARTVAFVRTFAGDASNIKGYAMGADFVMCGQSSCPSTARASGQDHGLIISDGQPTYNRHDSHFRIGLAMVRYHESSHAGRPGYCGYTSMDAQ